MKKSKLLFVGGLILIFTLVLSTGVIAKTYNIAVIVKATDSGFWQKVFTGAETADKKFGKVKITKHGPTSTSDIAEQISILENVITRRPDAIIIAPTSSDAAVLAIERAYDMGIKVITIDNEVNTEKVHSHLATDNVKAGKLAARKFAELVVKHGKSISSGKVGLISAMAGAQSVVDRDNGFKKGLKEVAPGLEILKTRYVNDRIPKALSSAQDIITGNPEELVGFFADNNHTGDGVARAISERGLADELPVVAFDVDDEEIRSLKEGSIDCLIVQDPFGMGYKGVQFAVDAIEGKELPDYIDTGVTAVTSENFNEAKIQQLLYPEKRAKAILSK